MNIIGPRMKQIRETKGYTQETFTARCNLVGFDISRGTLAKIESQVRRITDEVWLLSKALSVNVNQLFS